MSHTVYLNFDEEYELKSIFETNKNPQRIIELLSLIAGEKILHRETLIIFDEIQECPEALNALKYFKEKANEYHVIAAGSLLGPLLAKPALPDRAVHEFFVGLGQLGDDAAEHHKMCPLLTLPLCLEKSFS